jgi:hypothetical protein
MAGSTRTFPSLEHVSDGNLALALIVAEKEVAEGKAPDWFVARAAEIRAEWERRYPPC